MKICKNCKRECEDDVLECTNCGSKVFALSENDVTHANAETVEMSEQGETETSNQNSKYSEVENNSSKKPSTIRKVWNNLIEIMSVKKFMFIAFGSLILCTIALIFFAGQIKIFEANLSIKSLCVFMEIVWCFLEALCLFLSIGSIVLNIKNSKNKDKGNV